MSLDTTIHLEPFIKIKTLIGSNKEKIKSCQFHGKIETDYCSDCGCVAENAVVLIEYYKDIIAIIGNDGLWTYHSDNEYTYLFSNRYGCGFNPPEENEMTLVNIAEINKQIQQFKEIHKANIEKLQKHVKEKIIVEYGLFKHVR